MGDQQSDLFEGKKKCRLCKENKDIKEFMLYNSRGTEYRKNLCRECEREWQRKHSVTTSVLERKRLWQKRYREKDPDAYNAKQRLWKTAKRKSDRDTIYKAYGNKCACCGETNPKFFTIDHVNNDGHIERKSGKYTNGSMFYRQIVKDRFPPNYQILCYNCNLGRARNGGICPHQEDSETNPSGSTPKRVEAPTASK